MRGKQLITPLDVVKIFLQLQSFDTECGDVITNLKAQKLVYYAQGVHLAKNNLPIFDDDFVAWQHGPVIESLYKELKKFGSSQIEITIDDNIIKKFSDAQLDILIQVYKTFGRYSAWALRDMTHQESPWRDTKIGDIIEKDRIKSYFVGRGFASSVVTN